MITRRKFIATAAAAGTVLPFSGISFDNNYSNPVPARSKIHVFTKPFQWMSFEELSEFIASTGAEGIDLPVRPGGHIIPENVEKELPKAVEAARKNGLVINMIVTGITDPDDKFTEPLLKTASSLGITHYRLGWIPYDESLGISGTLEKLKGSFKKFETLNRKYSVHGAYQNHSGNRVGGPVWDLYELVKDLDPKYIGVQYDVRHAVVEGGSSWVNGLKLVAPWVKCTDIKDFVWSKTSGKWAPETVALGDGMVNFEEYFKIVRKYSIEGPVSLHLEYPPFERLQGNVANDEKKKLCLEPLRKDVKVLKDWFARFPV